MVLALSEKKSFLSQPVTRSIKCIHVRYNTDEAIYIVQNVESYSELPKLLISLSSRTMNLSGPYKKTWPGSPCPVCPISPFRRLNVSF